MFNCCFNYWQDFRKAALLNGYLSTGYHNFLHLCSIGSRFEIDYILIKKYNDKSVRE